MKKMKEECLLIAESIATNESERYRFQRKLAESESFWRQLGDAREQYFLGIEASTGLTLPTEKKKERHDAFMACATYLFSGLRFLDEPDEQKIPNISSELIEKMREEGDGALISMGYNLLGSAGDTNEIWVANFAKLSSKHNLNIQARGLLYGLAMAWISTREQEEEMEQRTKAMQATGLLDELDAVLKKVGVGEENQNQGKL